MHGLRRGKISLAILLGIIAYLSAINVHTKKKPNWAHVGRPEFVSTAELKEFVEVSSSDILREWPALETSGKAHIFKLRGRVAAAFLQSGYLDGFTSQHMRYYARTGMFPGYPSFGYYWPDPPSIIDFAP